MTSVMLACYPETFRGGAIIAGLPYGGSLQCAAGVSKHVSVSTAPAKDWGDLVRAAAPSHTGSWPRVSVWHGNVDKTVVPCNAREIIKQWTDVHGLPSAPSVEDTVADYPAKLGSAMRAQNWLNHTPSPIWRMAHLWQPAMPTSSAETRVPSFLKSGFHRRSISRNSSASRSTARGLRGLQRFRNLDPKPVSQPPQLVQGELRDRERK